MIQKETTGMILANCVGIEPKKKLPPFLVLRNLLGPCMNGMKEFPVMKSKFGLPTFFGKTVQELFYTPIEHYKCS